MIISRMEENALGQQQNVIPLDIFSILSKRDNISMFCFAKNGLKTHSTKLHDEIPSKKRYYKALKRLKDAGLIKKSLGSRGTYFHTTYGSIIYQRVIVEMTEYTGHIEKMKMIDTLRDPNTYSEDNILKLVESIVGIKVSSSFASEIIWSYEELISLIIEKIKNCRNELLIATRIYSERIINEIIHKSKIGINVKILTDTKLVQEYFKSQINYCDFNNNDDKYNVNTNNENERYKVIENPWYPNKEGINRRIMDIPFGILVIDGNEVGIELINRNNIQNFYAGIFIKDEKLAANIREFYLKMWNTSSDNDVFRNVTVMK
jgi:hypothetical protein